MKRADFEQIWKLYSHRRRQSPRFQSDFKSIRPTPPLPSTAAVCSRPDFYIRAPEAETEGNRPPMRGNEAGSCFTEAELMRGEEKQWRTLLVAARHCWFDHVTFKGDFSPPKKSVIKIIDYKWALDWVTPPPGPPTWWLQEDKIP